MKLLQIPMVRMIILEEIIDRADGNLEKLVEWPAGAHLSPVVHLRISEDRMLAEVLVDPPKVGGGNVTLEQFEHALEDQHVSAGIDREAVDICIEGAVYGRWVPVARGKEPVHGRGGRVKYHFNTDRGKPYRELAYGRIDLKELNFIQFKKEGELLAEREAPVQPEDGFDVLGEPVAANPMDEEQPLVGGDLTELRDGGLYALADGNARVDQGVILIEPVVTVNNVDYETGNLDFDGSVIIKGTVADGFHVKATGDIQAGKSVGRVRLEAGRNLVLQAGINGDREGYVLAGGDLYAKFIESSLVETAGSVIVTGSILHTTMNVSGHLLLKGGRSEILGGLAVIREWVKCRKIGSLYETKTNLIVGVKPEELEEFFDLLKEANQLREDLDNLDKRISHAAKQANRPGAPPHHLRMKIQLEKQARDVNSMIEDRQRQIQKIRKSLQPSTESFVLAEDMIYFGAKVSFGLTEFSPDQRGARKTILQFREGRIRETGYNPAEIPEDVARFLPDDSDR